MKKSYFALLALLAYTIGVKAKPVDVPTARSIAFSFWNRQAATNKISGTNDLQLVYTATKNNNAQIATYYVFNTSTNGFVIISADDIAYPVLGYSTESTFLNTNMPSNIAYWFNRYNNTISYGIEHNMKTTADVNSKWEALSTPTLLAKTTAVAVVLPLVKTKWNQSPYYNALCPFDQSANQLSVTGCVATAMSQVMKYWNYPAMGTGSHSYTPATNPQYGLQTANFDTTHYLWANMPTTLVTNNTPVATLMYNAGVSVDMDYSPTGSGAWVIQSQSFGTSCTEYALPTYFGYKNSLQGLDRTNFGAIEWLAMLKMEFNSSRPVIYVGFDNSAGGHCWVLDGYDVNDMIHTNWGWGGSDNGYYANDAMDPTMAGYAFDQGQEMVIGIEPAHPTMVLDLNAQITAPDTIQFAHPFSVIANMINDGTASFTGDYAVRAFDMQGNFIDTLPVVFGNTLTAGSNTGTLTFSTTGSTHMVPGTYNVGVFYRPTLKTWFQAGSGTGMYNNMTQIEVITPASVSTVNDNPVTHIYPNPATDMVNITLTDPISTNIQMSDIYGRKVYSTYLAGQTNISIPVSTFAEGTYFIQISSNKGTETSKVMIKK
ncbi:MAG: thiol protease/hemagglutinin PrtT [Bacteroidota bacterium]